LQRNKSALVLATGTALCIDSSHTLYHKSKFSKEQVDEGQVQQVKRLLNLQVSAESNELD
jgi:hypothetical protein